MSTGPKYDPAEELALALKTSLEAPVIPPRRSSVDGLFENEPELERLDDWVLDVLDDARGEVSVEDLTDALYRQASFAKRAGMTAGNLMAVLLLGVLMVALMLGAWKGLEWLAGL